MADLVESFIHNDLKRFIGKNIDHVGAELESIVLGRGYWYRWLERGDMVAPVKREMIPFRINVRVTKNHHKIIRMWAG